jgi:cytochrome c
MRLRLFCFKLALLSGLSIAAHAQDGAALFVKNCQTCHSIEKGAAARQGPPLHGVVGRKAGSVEGFKYSEGLKTAGFEWTPEKIDEWIAFPKKMIRSTTMVYRQNDPEIRKAIVAYLATLKD